MSCPEHLADDVIVGAFACVGPDVHIEAGARVDHHAVLDGRVTVGPDNHIHAFAVIGGADGGAVEIGRAGRIREHSVILAGGPEGRLTHIGSGVLVSTGCVVGSGAWIDDHVVLGTYSRFDAGARVETHAWTSAFTAVAPEVTIGQYSFTSGYAGIDRDAPPYAVLLGHPYRVRGVNTHNLKRCGFSAETVEGLKKAFRVLFNGIGGEANDAVIAEWSRRGDLDAHQRYLVDFLARRVGTDGKDQ